MLDDSHNIHNRLYCERAATELRTAFKPLVDDIMDVSALFASRTADALRLCCEQLDWVLSTALVVAAPYACQPSGNCPCITQSSPLADVEEEALRWVQYITFNRPGRSHKIATNFRRSALAGGSE